MVINERGKVFRVKPSGAFGLDDLWERLQKRMGDDNLAQYLGRYGTVHDPGVKSVREG